MMRLVVTLKNVDTKRIAHQNSFATQQMSRFIWNGKYFLLIMSCHICVFYVITLVSKTIQAYMTYI